MLLAGGALLLTALALIAIFQWLGTSLERLPRFGESVTWLLALPVPLIIVTLTFAMLFRFLPPVRLRWRHIWISAVVCACGWMIAAEVLTLYGIFFADKFGAWGAIGGLLMIMLWMNVVSQVLFYGAELCKVMSQETSGHSRSLSSWHEAEDSSARSRGPWDEQPQSPERPPPSQDASTITSRRNLQRITNPPPPSHSQQHFTQVTASSVSFSNSLTSERRER